MVTIEWVLDSWRDSLLMDLHGYTKARHDARLRMAGARPSLGCEPEYWRGIADMAEERIPAIRDELDHVSFLQRESRYIQQLKQKRLHHHQLRWQHQKI